jgi:hypothetical protein
MDVAAAEGEREGKGEEGKDHEGAEALARGAFHAAVSTTPPQDVRANSHKTNSGAFPAQFKATGPSEAEVWLLTHQNLQSHKKQTFAGSIFPTHRHTIIANTCPPLSITILSLPASLFAPSYSSSYLSPFKFTHNPL